MASAIHDATVFLRNEISANTAEHSIAMVNAMRWMTLWRLRVTIRGKKTMSATRFPMTTVVGTVLSTTISIGSVNREYDRMFHATKRMKAIAIALYARVSDSSFCVKAVTSSRETHKRQQYNRQHVNKSAERVGRGAFPVQ
jgi:hypothetical protein